ncbi:flagellar protein FlgN [Clostridium sp. Cult3]|uniref:flagellar protein FlgN n=1 Tax=Clostridium sp. Cult3 TaxID=2079004 RepID=UPI001F392B52|nr:flagellar protein FlgN [Clostridium sp. Cult3]MCF6460997.1 hypothetical protein [Clostridium sp. Cult3]
MTFKDELVSILEKELEVLKKLKDITFEKTDILIEDKVERLEEMTKEEEELISKMASAEEARLKLMDSWGLSIDISMTQVIDNIPEGEEELAGLKEQLQTLLYEIQSRNVLNNDLILENLQWLDFNMNLISNVQSPTTYGKGSQKNQSNNSLFDRKV